MSLIDVGNLKKNWWKIVIIALVFSIFYSLEHGLLPSNDASVLPSSALVTSGLLPIAFILYGALWFGILACIFAVIQHRLPGSKVIKGLVYALFFFLIVFMVYFEPIPHGGSFSFEMTWMLGDGAPLLLFGVLLGVFLASSNSNQKTYAFNKSGVSVVAVFVIAVIFFIGRLFDYTVLGIYSNFSTEAIKTLTWAFLFGLGISLLYFMLKPAIKQSSPIRTAVFFGVIIFGIYIVLFNFAFALIVDMALLPIGGLTIIDLLIRVVVDMFSITLGVLIYEYLVRALRNEPHKRLNT